MAVKSAVSTQNFASCIAAFNLLLRAVAFDDKFTLFRQKCSSCLEIFLVIADFELPDLEL